MKTQLKKSLLLLPLLTAACSLQAAAKKAELILPYLTLPIMQKAPVIDGKITDNEWKEAAQMQQFCDRSMLLFPAKADFRIGCDGKHLYIASTCITGPQGILRRVQPSKSNAMAYTDDSFEFVIVPNAKNSQSTVLHLIINANGAYYSQSVQNKNYAAWRPALKTASIVKNGFWNFEIALPLADTGLKKETLSTSFGIRICRNWKRLASRDAWGAQTSFENDKAVFFSSTSLPLVSFEKDAPAVQVTQLADPDSTDSYNVKLRIVNPGKKAVTVQTEVISRPKNSQPTRLFRKVTVGSGKSVMLSASGQALADELIDTLIRVTDPAGRKMYYQRNFHWRLKTPGKIFSDARTSDKDLLSAKFAFFPSENKIYLKVDVSSLKKKTATVNVTLSNANGKILAKTTLRKPVKGVFDSIWQVPDLAKETKKTGKNTYTLTYQIPGVPGTIKRTFVRNVMEWEGNKLGKSDVIVPPFTAIKVKGNTLSTVLRDHTLNSLGLLKQVKAAGKNILADNGMILEAVVNGKTRNVNGKDFRFSTVKRNQASASAILDHPSLKGSAASEWEYDGMLKWKLKLTGGNVDKLRLLIPVRNEDAPLLHACTDGLRFNYAGIVPAGKGRVWDGRKAARTSIVGSYVPYIWIGDELRGISVFGENDKGWVTNDKIPCQEIIRKNGKVYLVLNLITGRTAIKTPREIVLGFMATPVKPMPADWRAQQVNNPLTTGYFLGSTYYWGTQLSSAGIYPRKGDLSLWKEFARVRKGGKIDHAFIKKWVNGYCYDTVKTKAAKEKRYKCYLGHTRAGLYLFRRAAQSAAKGKPQKVLWYTNGRGAMLGTPEGMTFVDEWLCHPFYERQFNEDSGTFYHMDPVKSFRDYALWYYKKMFEMGVCDYLYWDDVFLQSNFNLVGTDSYKLPDGTIQPSSGIFNMREHIKRAATLQIEMGMPTQNVIHMTNTAIAPISSFAMVHYDWEDECSLQHNSTREYIRAVSIGKQYGAIPIAIGYLNRKTSEDYAMAYRAAAGVTLTHEIYWRHGYSIKSKLYRNCRDLLEKSGYAKPDLKAWNYWDKGYPVKISGIRSSSVLYGRNREFLLIVSDWSGGGKVNVKPDLKKIGLRKNFTAVNMETGKPVKVQNSTIHFRLNKSDFIMLKLK